MPSTSILFVSTILYIDPNNSEVYSWFSKYRYSEDWHTTYSDEEVKIHVNEYIKHFNSNITSMVNSKKKAGQKIRIADVNSVITDINSQLSDGIHPNNIGYKAIGDFWTEIISHYLNGK